MRRLIQSLIFLTVLAWPCNAQEAKLTVEAARKMLPQAAGMSNADAKALGEAQATSPDRIKSKSLSLVLLALDPEIAEKNADALKEFRYLGAGTPRPDRIAKAMSISKGQGYVSFIQPKYITDCTCESTAELAEGVVTFKNEVYEGRIAFVAQATKDGWTITEFRLPQYKTKVVRGKDGVWTRETLQGK